MRNPVVISELRAALRREGVWGPRADRLLQDWNEHVQEDAARRVEDGVAVEQAEEAAWVALGRPEVLAIKAGRELAQATWTGRHPWLTGLVLPVGAWFGLVCAIMLVPMWIATQIWDIEVLERTHPAALHAALNGWQAFFNLLPWLLSVVWLARIATRMPGGWKLFWITSIALSVFAPSIWMVVQIPQHGPGSGSLSFLSLGILGITLNLLMHAVGHGAPFIPWSLWFQTLAVHPWPLIQSIILVFGAFAFYARASGRDRWRVMSVSLIALVLILAIVYGAPAIVF